MKQEKLYCGIDVSNETIDVCIQLPNEEFRSETLPNSKVGFTKLIKLSGKQYHFVMEATGVYHLPLSFYLHALHYDYSVVNAIKIKRYIQTCLTARQVHLERNKSDKKDAKYICRYGIDQQPDIYQMPDALYFECKSLNNAIEQNTRDITSYKNLLHSLQKLPIGNKLVIKSYKAMIEKLALTLIQLEAELYKKLNEWQPELVKIVSSVVGIGKRATSLLIVSTQGFKNTESYKQLISYAGLSPKEYSSGTSINGRRRICKNGGG
jgi:transposase